MDEPVQFSIDGNDPTTPAERHTDADASVEMERTRRALSDAAAARNELLQARREHAAGSLETIEVEAARANQEFQRAWDEGDAAKMADSQRAIAAAEARRNNVQAVAAQLDRTQPIPIDPVEAFAAGRSSQAQEWLRSHPEFVLDGRKNSKLNAAHSDAIAEGISPDTPAYFKHINRFVGLEGGGRRSGGDSETLRVRVGAPKPGERLGANEVRMTPGEYKAATETLTWNYDSPDGKHKKGEALGVTEYLKRKNLMKQQPGWFDKLSD